MTRFNSALRMSVSVVALMGGASVIAGPVHALTVSTSEPSLSTGDIADGLVITSTGDIGPGGVLVAGDITGDFLNQGIVATVEELSVTNPDAIVDAAAVQVDDLITGDASNVGTITVDVGAEVVVDVDIDAVGSAGWLSGQQKSTATASGIQLDDVGKGVENEGVVSATADASSTYDLSLVATANTQFATTPDVVASATAISVDTVADGVTNSGKAEAVANASLTITENAQAGTWSETKLTSASADANAVGVELGTVEGVINAATISATGSADATVTLTVAAEGEAELLVHYDVDGFATGLTVSGSLDGDLSNSGIISADASADLAVKATVDSATSDAIYTAGTNSSYSNAVGVYVDKHDGAFDNKGEIKAAATANGDYDLSVTGQLDAKIQVTPYYVTPTATGVEIDSGTTSSFVNSGTISATALGDMALNLAAAGADGKAFVSVSPDAWAFAYGARLEGVVGKFDNSGTISATAANSLSETITATGKTDAFAQISNSVTVTGYGVSIDELTSSFVNTGTISADMTGANAMVADAASSEGKAQLYVEYSGSHNEVYGARIDDATGFIEVVDEDEVLRLATVTNDAKAVISAKGVATQSLDLGAAGESAVVTVDEVGQTVAGHGLQIVDGFYQLTNNGTISSDVSAATTIVASASASAADAAIDLEDVTLSIKSFGITAGGEVSGDLANAGDVSATASGSLTETLSATGATSASVVVDNALNVDAFGITVAQALDGDLTNSGKISASASGSVDVTASASFGTKTGTIDISNAANVSATGISASFSAPGEKEDPRAFDNSGTITAVGVLNVNTVVPASTDPEPVVETVASVAATGASLAGSLGVVNNSGTISAMVEATNVGNAQAVALSLPEAAEGLEITNSGTLSASVKGTATSATAVALQVGSLDKGSGLDETAVGVITVTNTGTISATNEAGGAYGIFAGFAEDPLVINQQSGSISAATAVEIENGNADVLNWTGGSIKGLVSADALDVVNVLQAVKDGKGVATTVTAGTDFALDGAGQLNIGGGKGAPVTFDFAGLATNVGATTVATDASLVIEPTGEIHGNTFTMQPDSKLTFVFNPTEAGLISTTGDATIDGTLGAVALPGLYGDKGSHVVVESDTKVVGTFDNVAITGDTLLLDFTAAVHAHDVTISWNRTPFDGVDGLSDNSAAVAGALEDGYDPTRPASKNSPELNDQLKGLFTIADAGLYDRVLNSWSGSEHAQVMRAATNLSEPYLLAIGEHLNDNRNAGFREQNVVMLRPKGSSNSIAPASSVGASAAEETGFAFWGRAYGRWADTRGDANAGGFDEDTYGAVLGVDFQVSPTILLGIAGSYTNDDIGFDDGDDAEIERWTIGGYASATFDAFYLDASFTYASDDYEVNRTIITGGVACLAYNCSTGAASKYDGDGLIVHAEAGFNWVLGEGVRLQPFAGLNYTGMDTDAFGEVGGGDLGLQVLDGTGKSFQSRLGARLSGEWGSGDVTWVPELRAEWRHEFEDQPAWIVSNLVGLPDDPFLTVGSHVSGDLAVIGAGITAQMANGWGLYLDYQGAFASGYSSHAIQGGARFRF